MHSTCAPTPTPTQQHIPLLLTPVHAGFPSPAEPYIARHLDFNNYLVTHPAATIAIYAQGNAMQGAGIQHNDLLIINRALTPQHRDLVMIEIEHQHTLRRLIHTPLGHELHTEPSPDATTAPTTVINHTTHPEITYIGVITHIIKKSANHVRTH